MVADQGVALYDCVAFNHRVARYLGIVADDGVTRDYGIILDSGIAAHLCGASHAGVRSDVGRGVHRRRVVYPAAAVAVVVAAMLNWQSICSAPVAGVAPVISTS